MNRKVESARSTASSVRRRGFAKKRSNGEGVRSRLNRNDFEAQSSAGGPFFEASGESQQKKATRGEEAKSLRPESVSSVLYPFKRGEYNPEGFKFRKSEKNRGATWNVGTFRTQKDQSSESLTPNFSSGRLRVPSGSCQESNASASETCLKVVLLFRRGEVRESKPVERSQGSPKLREQLTTMLGPGVGLA